jgi:hypothetical protein
MKLKKDEFRKSDIDAAGEKIKELLLDYVEKNRLVASISRHSTNTVSLTQSTVNIGDAQVISFKRFMNEQFKFMNENFSPSHKISIYGTHKLTFTSDALKKLNKSEKIILIKGMISLRPSFSDLDPKSGFISEDDFWLHLRHIAPFTKIKPQQRSDDVRVVLDIVASRSLDTQEKIDSLAYFLNYYKIIAKRTDIKAGLIRLLKSKIDEEHYPVFENILSSKFSNLESEFNIFSPTPDVKLLVIQKDSIFEQVPFVAIPQAKTDDYNKYLLTLNRFLQSPKASSILNIAKIDFHELSATKEPARVYIQAKEGGFKEDIQEIYAHLVKSCADSYPSKLIDSAFETSLNYFLLNKAVANKDENLEPKRKVMKV